MPYGELALVHFYKSRIQVETVRPNYDYNARQQPFSSRGDLRKDRAFRYSAANSFGRAERYLSEYLIKAKEEQRIEDVVHALTNLGDLNLLFERSESASQYYELAWTEAQKLKLDNPLVQSFDKPQALPAFNYSRDRKEVKSYRKTVRVATTFSVNELGRVKKFAELDDTVANKDMVRSARRAAKRLQFRPVIENGRMIAISEFTYEVKVRARQRQATTNKG